MNYTLDNNSFDIAKEHRIGDVNYPAGWFLDPSNRLFTGIVEVPGMPAPPLTPLEIAANAKNAILFQIAKLEDSITNRMWREDALNSISVFPSNHPTWANMTATQVIGQIDAEINALKLTLTG